MMKILLLDHWSKTICYDNMYLKTGEIEKMKVQIIRIEANVVSCQLEDGHILDIDRKWLPEDIKLDDELDFNVEVAKRNK